MDNLRTRIRSSGDVYTERTTPDRAGEFCIETEIGKFSIPIDVSGSNFSRQAIKAIVCLENVGYITGSTLVLSSSTISNVTGVSASIAFDINHLQDELTRVSSSYITSSAETIENFNNVNNSITNLSSSFVTTISIFSGSTANDINELRNQDALITSSINELSTSINLNLNSISSSIAIDIHNINNSTATITASIINLSSSIVSSFNQT
ncbi:MAG TPA: hypothetical protein PKZ12_04240, partial [Smithellaceae bacterium]|nr:hypothetical protein [Smithellaceae bacterium]